MTFYDVDLEQKSPLLESPADWGADENCNVESDEKNVRIMEAKKLDSESESEKDKTWVKYAKIILPHIGLIFLSCTYIVIGALVFYYLERPHEVYLRTTSVANITTRKRNFLESLWNASEKSAESEWKSSADDEIQQLTRMLFDAFESNFVTSEIVNNRTAVAKNHWTLPSAVFFTATLLTTIGYGNIVPKTFGGRMFCIWYGLLGVPLILITVADVGKFLSENIIWLYTNYRKLKKKLQCVRKRQGSMASLASPQASIHEENENELEDMALYDYVSIPVTLVLLILVGYTALGALILSSVEGWSFFNAFYFSFITMTTVGFGDLYPEKEAYLILNLLYIVVGLAITTMCIDLVGIQYIRKIHNFGRAIQDARYALVNVGGRMVQVGDLMKYAALLHRRYGTQQAAGAEITENPLSKLFPYAFIPDDINYIRYIDRIRGSHESLYSWKILQSEPSPSLDQTALSTLPEHCTV